MLCGTVNVRMTCEPGVNPAWKESDTRASEVHADRSLAEGRWCRCKDADAGTHTHLVIFRHKRQRLSLPWARKKQRKCLDPDFTVRTARHR